jgi:hypothetical protein
MAAAPGDTEVIGLGGLCATARATGFLARARVRRVVFFFWAAGTTRAAAAAGRGAGDNVSLRFFGAGRRAAGRRFGLAAGLTGPAALIACPICCSARVSSPRSWAARDAW